MKNTIKIMKIMTVILMLVFTMGLTTATTAEAASKFDEVDTLKVISGESKIVDAVKKIKKVKIISKNKNFKVKKTGSYQYIVSGTDKGKTQTIKVTYKNKHAEHNNTYTVKVKIKTVALKGYKKKVIKELKALMVDPDKGLQTVLVQWEKKLGYECDFRLMNTPVNGTTTYMTLDEITKNYTASQKKALILEAYCRARMTYGLQGHDRMNGYIDNRGKDSFFKLLYKGKFWGLCDEGAHMGYDIGQLLGLKTRYTQSGDLDHAWCNIYVTDKTGKSYWQGIYTTSYAFNLKKSVPQQMYGGLSRKQVEKYQYDPYKTYFHPKKKQVEKTPSATTTPDSTETPAPTASLTITEPIKDADGNILVMPSAGYTCPGCNPLNPPSVRHTDNTNPYITNSKTTYQDYVVYKHVIGTETRWFDADGNEYIDINNNGSIMDELITLAGQ